MPKGLAPHASGVLPQKHMTPKGGQRDTGPPIPHVGISPHTRICMETDSPERNPHSPSHTRLRSDSGARERLQRPPLWEKGIVFPGTSLS